jgi:hypothetical protein
VATSKDKPGPWVAICQPCWEQVAPDAYFPDAMYYKDCALCGAESCITGHIRKGEVDEYKALTGWTDRQEGTE